jgi:hypothetical protein
MDIASILSSTTDTGLGTSVAQTQSTVASSFESYFLDATDSSSETDISSETTSSTDASSDASSESGLEEFMQYAKETPAQRFFDSWLSSQNITEDQYNAMPSTEKQKLMDEFETQMKAKLNSETKASETSLAVA